MEIKHCTVYLESTWNLGTYDHQLSYLSFKTCDPADKGQGFHTQSILKLIIGTKLEQAKSDIMIIIMLCLLAYDNAAIYMIQH